MGNPRIVTMVIFGIGDSKMATLGIRSFKSPIPSDPGYEHEYSYDNSGSLSYRPRGRTTWAAEDIAKHQVQGTIARILYPESDSVPLSSRCTFKHPQSKDFLRINARKVKELQGKCQGQLEEEAKKGPMKGVHLADKYSHIQPKVTAYIKTPRPQSARQQQQHKQQQEKEQKQTKSTVAHVQRPHSARQYRSASLSRLDLKDDIRDLAQFAPGTPKKTKKKNYLNENAKNVGAHKIARPPSVEHLVSLQKKREREFEEYKRGVVPTYLKERQNEWRREFEEKRRNAPDPSIPPGHALMPKEERIRTLNLLEETHTSLTKQLQQMPVRSDTYKLRTKKSEIESKLAEIDDAIKIFSRNKVFVKLDE